MQPAYFVFSISQVKRINHAHSRRSPLTSRSFTAEQGPLKLASPPERALSAILDIKSPCARASC